MPKFLNKRMDCGACVMALAAPSQDEVTAVKIAQVGTGALSQVLGIFGGNSPVAATQPTIPGIVTYTPPAAGMSSATKLGLVAIVGVIGWFAFSKKR